MVDQAKTAGVSATSEIDWLLVHTRDEMINFKQRMLKRYWDTLMSRAVARGKAGTFSGTSMSQRSGWVFDKRLIVCPLRCDSSRTQMAAGLPPCRSQARQAQVEPGRC